MKRKLKSDIRDYGSKGDILEVIETYVHNKHAFVKLDNELDIRLIDFMAVTSALRSSDEGETVGNDFNQFIKSYQKHSGKTGKRASAEKGWLKLSKEDRLLVIKNHIPYIQSVEEKKYVREVQTYINEKLWNSEYVQQKQKTDKWN